METFGLLSLIPVAIIVILALWTKDTFISILIGVLSAFLIIAHGNPLNAFNGFVDSLYTTLCDDGTVWVLMLCGLFGSLIKLLQESGGVLGFTHLAQKVLKGRKSSMIGAWILGIIVFVDDYLNCLAVGAAVRDITDKNKVSREMLAYIVNSTGVTVCAIIPFTTWSAYMGGLMKKSGMIEQGSSVLSTYIDTIPFVLYGWLAVIFVPLFCLKIVPLFGPMKKAEKRALETGEVFSKEAKEALVELPDEETKFEGKSCRAINFLAPIILVAILTITTEDILIGLFAGIGLSFVMYIPQRLMSVKKFFNYILDGLVDMFPLLILIIVSYCLIDANDQMGLIDFVTGAALDTVTPALLPVTIFVVIGLLSFAAGSFWGLAAIAFPIVVPLADALGSNPLLCAGALISAVCFGGHICIYSDTVILTAASTQTTPAEYFRTSGPLVAVPAILAVILFTVFGFIMS